MTIFQVDIACIERNFLVQHFLSYNSTNAHTFTQYPCDSSFFSSFMLLYFVVCCFISYTENDIEICSIREWKVFLRFITFLFVCCSVRKCRSKVCSHNQMFTISIKTGNAKRKTSHSNIYKHEH